MSTNRGIFSHKKYSWSNGASVLIFHGLVIERERSMKAGPRWEESSRKTQISFVIKFFTPVGLQEWHRMQRRSWHWVD